MNPVGAGEVRLPCNWQGKARGRGCILHIFHFAHIFASFGWQSEIIWIAVSLTLEGLVAHSNGEKRVLFASCESGKSKHRQVNEFTHKLPNIYLHAMEKKMLSGSSSIGHTMHRF
jgi:hypothetical protein